MKAKLLERRNPFDKSFNTVLHSFPYFLDVWHYHPELELVYIIKSSGTRFIGDSIRPFYAGELVLIGQDLPHLWQNEKIYFEKESKLTAEAITIHFKRDFAGEQLMEIPEMKGIRELVERAVQGIVFRPAVGDKAKDLMLAVHEGSGFQRLHHFLELLDLLSKEADYELLSTPGFIHPGEKSGDSRIDKVYSFTFNNFRRNITLEEVADVANLNPTAFCRFFKKVTKKNYSKFLNEIRIGYACKLLIEQKLNISGVGYEAGFNNLSNFNRQFKGVLGVSPSAYLEKHQKHK